MSTRSPAARRTSSVTMACPWKGLPTWPSPSCVDAMTNVATRILAIDQSTSATKALLFDAAGRLLDKAAVDHRQIYPQPGFVEHDAEEIWRNMLAAMKTLVERNGDAIQSVSHLSITNQRETVVVFERGTGR